MEIFLNDQLSTVNHLVAYYLSYGNLR